MASSGPTSTRTATLPAATTAEAVAAAAFPSSSLAPYFLLGHHCLTHQSRQSRLIAAARSAVCSCLSTQVGFGSPGGDRGGKYARASRLEWRGKSRPSYERQREGICGSFGGQGSVGARGNEGQERMTGRRLQWLRWWWQKKTLLCGQTWTQRKSKVGRTVERWLNRLRRLRQSRREMETVPGRTAVATGQEFMTEQADS